MTYRTGNHWGVTIVREPDNSKPCSNDPAHLGQSECAQLVAVVVNGDQELAEHICDRLNASTPDVPYTHGGREALAEVRRRLDITAEPDEQLFAATIHKILEHAAAELGLDEDGPSGPAIQPQSDQNRSGVAEPTPDTQNGSEALADCDGAGCTHWHWKQTPDGGYYSGPEAAERAREDT